MAGLPTLGRVSRRPTFASYPFTLGVASGDPRPDGVVLWTRLAPDPIRGGGMPRDESVQVQWRVATDERLSNVVRRGAMVAPPELGHAVHIEVDGLEPDRWYWYQFSAGSETSPIGRTKTTPVANEYRPVNFVFASCQHYEQGFFTAFRHMAEEDLDFVVHLGDYIYEYEGNIERVRMHTGREVDSLEDYRNRYALYKLDPDLQAAHAAFPWIVTSDDHEVDNNYAGAHSQDHDPADAFLARRANAYRAYYEHMPLRRPAVPVGPDMRLFRRLSIGGMAQLFVLDTRQYRTDQPCDDRAGPRCEGAFDPNATMLGPEQEIWLYEGLHNSDARWNVLAQQVMMAPVDRIPGPDERYSMDQWSGYEEARVRILQFLKERGPQNPVVLTGDIHSNWVNDLLLDARDESSPIISTEFVGTSISSGGDGADRWRRSDDMMAENSFVKYFNGQRGYVRCRLTSAQWQSDYRTIPYVSQPDAPIATHASFVVENGRPGAERV